MYQRCQVCIFKSRISNKKNPFLIFLGKYEKNREIDDQIEPLAGNSSKVEGQEEKRSIWQSTLERAR